MKKLSTRIALFIFISLFLISNLLACTNQPSPSTTTTPSTPPASESKTSEAPQATESSEDSSTKEAVTITINTTAGKGTQESWEAVAAGYSKLNPHVKVVVDLKPEEGYGEWVQNIYTTKNPSADVININLAGAAAVGNSINFLEYADNDSPYSDSIWTDQFNFPMQVIDLARNEWTALSLNSVQVLWLYNKDIFDEVGVTPPTTWKELIAVSEKIAAAGYQPISIPGDFNSFWSEKMGWLSQIYADQTTRSMINEFRAQKGDYCYDPDIDGIWKYDPTDPYNDDNWNVNYNAVRAFKSVKEGVYAPDSVGMKTVWENFAQIFPKYAGGEAFFGTKEGISLFYQSKSAMTVDGAWRLLMFERDMEKVAQGESVDVAEGVAVDGVKKFNIGTFNMPSMEGEGIEAPARTIEVANGFIGAIKKDKAHDDQVVDFLMYYSSAEGQSLALEAGLAAGGSVNGPSLVYGVTMPKNVEETFKNLSFIGNCQKGYSQMLARGIAGSAGDIQESYRLFYDYAYKYLAGKIKIDDFLTEHKKNIMTYLPEAMSTSGISEKDLENPQNTPTGS